MTNCKHEWIPQMSGEEFQVDVCEGCNSQRPAVWFNGSSKKWHVDSIGVFDHEGDAEKAANSLAVTYCCGQDIRNCICA